MTTRALTRERSEFSLTRGGPFYRLLIRLRLKTPTRTARVWWLGAAMWLPIVAGEGVRFVLGRPIDRALFDLSLHVRLLFTLPMLLLVEQLLDSSARSAIGSLYNGKFAEPARIDHIVDHALRMRDSWRAELALVIVALAAGQLTLWKVTGAAGLFHGVEGSAGLTFSHVWYATVALPLVQFVMFRWIWRWVIWSYMIVRISRLQLNLVATHADLACGLAALARPVTGFSGFVLAEGAILAAAWGTEVIGGDATMRSHLPHIAAFLVTSAIVATIPLLLLSGQLARARRRTLAQYGDFVRDYTLQFHAKWIERQFTTDGSILGSSDMQSLNDLGQAYQVAAKTRVFVFGPRTILTVWFAGLAPMLPLVASTLTFEHVLNRIFTVVLGGLPF